MFTRLNKIYHEFPRLFWIVVTVSFIDGVGGTLLFPFFALYITQKFGVGMTQAGILLGSETIDLVRSDFQRHQYSWIWFRQQIRAPVPSCDRRGSPIKRGTACASSHDCRHPA